MRTWLAGGAFATGVGIWSTRFIGMLAFRPPIPPGHDPAVTLCSLLIAITGAGYARDPLRPSISSCSGTGRPSR